MTLKDCINSIENQNFKNFEVWIIDNYSADGTSEFLATLNHKFHYVSESDNGIYEAMNKGVGLAKGEWLYFLGANDLFYNEAVLEEVFLKKYDNSIKIIMGKIKYLQKQTGKEHLFASTWSHKIWLKNCVHHQSAFYHSSLFKTNIFPLNYKVLADYALNLMFYKSGVKAAQISTIIALCDPFGKSKEYSWSQYKEEIHFKTKQSSLFLKPLFFVLGVIKFFLNKKPSF